MRNPSKAAKDSMHMLSSCAFDGVRTIGESWKEFTEGEKLALKLFIIREFKLEQLEVVRSPDDAQSIIDRCERCNIKVDLLSVDIALIQLFESPLVKRLCDLVSGNGMLFLESNNNKIQLVMDLLPTDGFEVVFKGSSFFVFAKKNGVRSASSMSYQIDLFNRKRYIEYQSIERLRVDSNLPEVAAFLLTEFHEASVKESLRSVLNQRGRFRMRVLVIDDASSDNTVELARSVIAENLNAHISVELIVQPKAIGFIENWKLAMTWAEGADFVAPCSASDLWTSEFRIQEQINFLRRNPKVFISFNTFGSSIDRSRGRTSALIAEEVVSGVEIIEERIHTSLSATFYRGELADIIPFNSFPRCLADEFLWAVSIYCGQIGGVAYLNKPLSEALLRGITKDAGRCTSESNFMRTLSSVSIINPLLDFNYTREFQRLTEACYRGLGDLLPHCDEDSKKIDLLILDDTFPTPKNGFRYLEYISYLKEFPSSLVLSSGSASSLVDQTPHEDLILEFQRKFPELGNRVLPKPANFPLQLCKLVYIMFLHNTYAALSEIEKADVPFVFTLYPGGGFALNDVHVDRKLARIFRSPCFHKVIVTQKVIYDYILKKSLCATSQIELILGGVMPEVVDKKIKKRRWGFEKSQLDICFMAHKYTPRGEDKGYDVFIEVAKVLAKKSDDIYFHVAGGFDQHVIDVSSLGNKIRFYGPLGPEKIDSFFKDMDLILSPNISGQLYSGSIDGFPTGCCVDAGMRGIAIFATDEYCAATNVYVDQKDIVIIKYDVDDIVSKIMQFHASPAALKTVGENGLVKLRLIHSMQAQIVPRIDLLRHAMTAIPQFDALQALKRTIAAMETELGRVNEEIAGALGQASRSKNIKRVTLLRGIYRFSTGRSNVSSKQLWRILRFGGVKDLKRCLRNLGN